MTVACGAGAIQLGFPVITNDTEENNMFRVPKSLIIQEDVSKFNATSLEARDIKIKITKIDIPVAFSSAFEGEIIRRGDMQVEFDGSRVDCSGAGAQQGAQRDRGPQVHPRSGPTWTHSPWAPRTPSASSPTWPARTCSTDFESVFERKFHAYVNCMEGVMHTGQRDMIRVRVSKAAFEAGLRLKHFAEVLYAKLKSDYDAVIDKCQVTIITDPEECKKFRHEVAIPAYDKRDERLQSLTDENVDQFYTCIMCQSFSPSHVCIVTPERLGLCGAVSWLDAKATNELDPSGPLPGRAQGPLSSTRTWAAGRRSTRPSTSTPRAPWSTSPCTPSCEDPMTSCGCFECICGIEPFSNGVVIVNREHAGMTPLGMTFSEMASMTGGGVQTPGFMGHGKHFISSKKFMKAEGGLGPYRLDAQGAEGPGARSG